MSLLVFVRPFSPEVQVRRLANPDAPAVPWEFGSNADIVDGPSTLLLRWPLSLGRERPPFFQRRRSTATRNAVHKRRTRAVRSGNCY
jgi:hypothetical protein